MKDINHKDGCRANNTISLNPDGSINEEKSNLEWCTRQYNVLHGYRSNKHLPNNRKSVMCMDTGEVFNSFSEAGRKYNISSPSNIIRSIRRGGKCNGLRWAYCKTN
jgi:hypothetical protein